MRQLIVRKYQILFFMVFSLAVFGGIPTLAATGEDSSDRQATTLETITVTANKQEESLHEVPQAITVIDEEMIEEKGIKSVKDIVNQIPNMTNTDMLSDDVNFRGLGTSAFTGNNPVVVYVDGVPTISTMAYKVALQNAQRIEVLRGPQGTLYGKDAIGAVINIITKKPRDAVSGMAELEYSSFNTFDAKFNVSAPLINEKLYFGVNASGKKSDGWIENTYLNDKKAGKSEDNKFGAYLLARPIKNLSIKLDLSHKEAEAHKTNCVALQGTEDISKFKRELVEKQAFDMPFKHDTKIDVIALNMDYTFDTLKFTSISTYTKTKIDGLFDFDSMANTPMDGMDQGRDERNKEFTQELRLSNKSEKMQWVGGLYFDKGEEKYPRIWMQMPGLTFNFNAKQKHQTLAAFGQSKFKLADSLGLTLGGRLQRFTRDTDSKFLPNPQLPGIATNNFVKAEKNWNAFLPKLALDYKLNDNLMPYVLVSKGYMPGGFNFSATKGGAEENTFEPQTSVGYELGMKGAYKVFSFTANMFRMDIKDTHVYKITGGNVWETGNAKKAHSQGAEFDFIYWPANEIEISGAFGYIDAKYDDHDLGGGVNLKGEQMHATPEFSANLGIAYYHGSGFYGRVDGRGIGETSYYDGSFKEMKTVGSSFFADVKIGYRIGNFDMYGLVTNISDEERMTGYVNRGDIAIASFNDPRTFGLGINYKF